MGRVKAFYADEDRLPQTRRLVCPGCARRVEEWAEATLLCRGCKRVFDMADVGDAAFASDDAERAVDEREAIANDLAEQREYEADDFGGFSDL